MIQDHAVNVFSVERVIATLRALRLVLVAEAAAQVTHDHVRGVANLEREIPERDAVARRGLAGDREVRLVQHQLAFQRNRAGNAEHYRPRPLGRAEAFPQRPRPGVGEVRHAINIPAPPAAGEATEAFRAGEGRDVLGSGSAGCERGNCQQPEGSAAGCAEPDAEVSSNVIREGVFKEHGQLNAMPQVVRQSDLLSAPHSQFVSRITGLPCPKSDASRRSACTGAPVCDRLCDSAL